MADEENMADLFVPSKPLRLLMPCDPGLHVTTGPDFLPTGSFTLVEMGGTAEARYNTIALVVSTSDLSGGRAERQ